MRFSLAIVILTLTSPSFAQDAAFTPNALHFEAGANIRRVADARAALRHYGSAPLALRDSSMAPVSLDFDPSFFSSAPIGDGVFDHSGPVKMYQAAHHDIIVVPGGNTGGDRVIVVQRARRMLEFDNEGCVERCDVRFVRPMVGGEFFLRTYGAGIGIPGRLIFVDFHRRQARVIELDEVTTSGWGTAGTTELQTESGHEQDPLIVRRERGRLHIQVRLSPTVTDDRGQSSHTRIRRTCTYALLAPAPFPAPPKCCCPNSRRPLGSKNHYASAMVLR